MTAKEAKQLVCHTAEDLVNEGLVRPDGCLSCRLGNILIITPAKAQLKELKPDDLIEMDLKKAVNQDGMKAPHGLPRHKAIYMERQDINALIEATSSSVLTSSRTGLRVYPLLDDMAQIVGVSIKTAENRTDRKSLLALVKAIRRRNAVFISGEGALCGGGSLDDAHAVCQVSEKACKAAIESSILGGGHRINWFESRLMRLVYLKKYSQQSVKNK